MRYHYVIMADGHPLFFRWKDGSIDVLLFSSAERAAALRDLVSGAVGIGTLHACALAVMFSHTYGRVCTHYLLDVEPEDFEGMSLREESVYVRWPLTRESLEGVLS